MIKQTWKISETERNRIISLHENATKNFYVLSEQDSSEPTNDISLEKIIDFAKNLPYEEKIKLVLSIVPKEDFHNARYREEITRLALGLPPKESKATYGEDLPGLSLKSMSLRSGCKRNPVTGKYPITGSQKVMELGRIDKNTTQDKKKTIVDIWGETGPILRLQIDFDKKFEEMYNELKGKKQQQMQGNVQKRDSAILLFKDIINYGLTWKIIDKTDDVELKLKMNGCPID
jgi:hypothetical protein